MITSSILKQQTWMKNEKDLDLITANPISRFHEAKKNDAIMAASNCFGDTTNIHPFKDGNGRICCLILVHTLFVDL